MEWERDFSIDSVEQQLIADERIIGQLRARQIRNLEMLDAGQVFTADGSRNLSEWLAARADIGSETARALVRTMRRTQDKPWLREAMASGAATFDRVEAVSRIPQDVGTMGHLDVASVRRNAASYVEVTSDDEIRSAEDRFLVMQPSLDESWWKIWGGLDGIAGAAIDDVLTEKADALPELPDGTRGTHSWRRATALLELATGGVSPKAQITVFVDADNATRTDGKAGVRLEAGPRVGARALASVMCDSIQEVTVNAAEGVPMRYGRKSRGIPSSLRTAILATNHGYCQADGCNSRYRVEVHHRIPWALGGPTDPENLVALCWFHHHIVVHERGFELHDDPTSGRLRFRRPLPSRSDERPPPVGSNRTPKG